MYPYSCFIFPFLLLDFYCYFTKEEDCQGFFFSFVEIFVTKLDLKEFSCSCKVLFSYFFYLRLRLFDGIRLKYSFYLLFFFSSNVFMFILYSLNQNATVGRLEGEEQLLIGIVLECWRLEIALDHLTCYRNNGSQYYRWTISLFCIH